MPPVATAPPPLSPLTDPVFLLPFAPVNGLIAQLVEQLTLNKLQAWRKMLKMKGF
jgi:hypothetical protein